MSAMAAKFASDEIMVIRRMAMQGACAVEIAQALKRDPTSIRSAEHVKSTQPVNRSINFITCSGV